jgi:PAS domain S-box-containing protein
MGDQSRFIEAATTAYPLKYADWIKSYLHDVSRPDVLRFAIFAGAYFLSVTGSEHLYGSRAVPSPFWLPDSILLCALLLTPRSSWWVLILASWPIRFVAGAPDGTPLWFVLASTMNDSLKALLAGWLLHRLIGRPVRLATFREFMIFLGVAAALVPLISAIGAVPPRYALGDPLWSAGYKWFMGDAVAQVIVTPATLYWCTGAYRHVNRRLTEFGVLFLGLTAVLYYTFGVHHADASPVLLYMPVPFLIWAAVRLRPFGAANAMALVSLAAVLGAVEGDGVFSGGTSNQIQLSIQFFLVLGAVSSLSLAILFAERESRTRELEVLLDAAPIAILMATDTECTNVRANHIGRRPDHVPEPAIAAGRHSLRQAAASGRPVTGDAFSWRLDDGTERYMLGNAAPLVGDDGQPYGAIGAFMDITERKRAEAALRESQQRFRLVADTAPVMIWMSGTDKWRTFFNKVWLDFTGRPHADELGDGWASGVHPDDIERCYRTYSKAFDVRRRFEMEYRLRRCDGEYRWIVDYGVPRFEADGTFCGYIGSGIDITDRKLAEAQLQELSGRLIEAQEQERARIARELHDDVCQRMALLQINIERFRQSAVRLSADHRLQVAKIAEGAAQCSSEIRQLSHRLHPSTLEILGLLDTLEGFCREFSVEHHVKVRFSHRAVPEDLAEHVSACVMRIVQESLHNVVKHSGAAAAKVVLAGADERLELFISDAGAGFDPDAVRKKDGLGLVSMRERLRSIGGRLEVQSAPSRGTHIRVTVPATRAPRALR